MLFILSLPISIIFAYLLMMKKRPMVSEERIMALIFFLNRMVMDLIDFGRLGSGLTHELEPNVINLEHATEFNPSTQHLVISINLIPKEFLSIEQYQDPSSFALCIRKILYIPEDLYSQSRAAKSITLSAYWGKEIIFKETYNRTHSRYSHKDADYPKLIVKNNNWFIRNTIDNTVHDIFVKYAADSIDYEY
jgi:hypothetical protein